ncbi:MAG: pilus assembly protein TadG-related protein [Alphaproteobacteria bacterium]
MMGTLVSRFRRLGRRFAKDERGSIVVFLAAGLIVLIGVVGLGVDTVRGYLVQSRLSAALDSAGLAGARVMFSPTRDADIQMYFAANFPPGYMGATVTGPIINVDPGNSVLTLSASADVGTSFMRVLGFDTMTVASASQITRQTNYLEVMLAIDVSGSMGSSVSGGGSRIAAARTAAKSLTQILYDAAATPGSLQIGLVPWNGKVNVGINGVAFDAGATPPATNVSSFTNPLTGATQTEVYTANNSPVPLLDPPPTDWRGCVFQRHTNDADNANDADLLIGGMTVGGADWPAWEPVKTYNPGAGEPISGGTCDLEAFGKECTECPDEGITDMTITQTTIDNAIDELSAGGYTNAVQGMVWAWQVLMPTPPFTKAFTSLPPNTTRKRAIVLLTDGELTGRSGDGYKAVFGNSTNAQGNGTNDFKMNHRLKLLATAIKNEGITIYTVQFANTSGSLADLLKAVSTGPAPPFYNTAASQQALDDVFKEIANDLAELHLSM